MESLQIQWYITFVNIINLVWCILYKGFLLYYVWVYSNHLIMSNILTNLVFPLHFLFHEQLL